MQYDDGILIKDFTSIDNEVLEKIYQSRNLTGSEKDILLSLCRQVFYQPKKGIVQTEWWASALFTAKRVKLSERTVWRAYKTLEKMNVLKRSLALRLTKGKNGKQVYRETLRIKFNTKVQQWAI
jgi:hypothetical protein